MVFLNIDLDAHLSVFLIKNEPSRVREFAGKSLYSFSFVQNACGYIKYHLHALLTISGLPGCVSH